MRRKATTAALYPWGNDWNAAAVPAPDKSRTMRGPDSVSAHPAGASPFGVMDLVGNVWQWTDEYIDEHTRGGILRGGSYYQPQGSIWYFPQAYKLDEHGKLLLMAPSKDRRRRSVSAACATRSSGIAVRRGDRTRKDGQARRAVHLQRPANVVSCWKNCKPRPFRA